MPANIHDPALSDDELVGTLDVGAAGVLSKPFDPRTLADDVKALLTGRSTPDVASS